MAVAVPDALIPCEGWPLYAEISRRRFAAVRLSIGFGVRPAISMDAELVARARYFGNDRFELTDKTGNVYQFIGMSFFTRWLDIQQSVLDACPHLHNHVHADVADLSWDCCMAIDDLPSAVSLLSVSGT